MKENKVSTNGDGKLALAIIVLLLVIDQAIKIWVKTHMCIGESIHIADWFQILFIENNGMAYGMTFFNKLVLSLFRLVAIGAIGYYLWRLVHREHSRGYVVCMAMVLAGASGNLFDSMFYGLCSTTRRSTRYPISCLSAQATPISFTARSSTCSISRSS